MSKILISSIGTGQKKENGYRKAKYEYNGQIKETEFISKALTSFLNIDKLYLIGTKKSIWDSVYKQFGGKNSETEFNIYEMIENNSLTEENFDIINNQIEDFLNGKGSKCFLIDYGINEQELWSNFSKYIEILDLIKDGDEIYLDITHSFRSLALMSFIMIEFGNIIKNKKFTIKAIFYGMLEFSYENNGISPIIDLKILYDLMQWIKAIDNLKKYGNGFGISELLEKNNEKKAYKIFNQFNNIMSIGYIASLKEFIKNNKSKIDKIFNTEDKLIKLLYQNIIDFLNRFDNINKLSYFQFELSKWYFENQNYKESYSSLLESIISYKCEINRLDPTNKEDREKGKHLINNKNNSKDITNLYHTIRKIRNNSAHFIDDRESYKTDINNLKIYIRKIKTYLKGVTL